MEAKPKEKLQLSPKGIIRPLTLMYEKQEPGGIHCTTTNLSAGKSYGDNQNSECQCKLKAFAILQNKFLEKVTNQNQGGLQFQTNST